MRKSGEKAGVLVSIIIILAIMAVKFIGINTIVQGIRELLPFRGWD